MGTVGFLGWFAASARANTVLFTTTSDFSNWTAGNATPAASTLYDFDGSTTNGAGNTAGTSTGAGSLQLTDTSNLGYGTLVYAPNEVSNSAFLTALDPGSVAAYTVAPSYGPGSTVAYNGSIQVTYTIPTISSGSYLQLGVLFNYNSAYATSFQSTSVSDGTVNGLSTYTATIPYSIKAGALGYLSFGIMSNSNYVPTSPFYLDDISVVNPVSFNAVNANWITNGSGTWEAAANWNPSAPGIAGSNATFDSNGGTITVNPTVTLSSAVTVDSINFNTSAVSYTIVNGGGGSITLDTNTGNQVNVFAGNHSISAPVVMAGSTTFNISTGSSLTVPTISGGGYGSVTLAGGGNLTTGLLQNVTLYINAGTYTMLNGVDNGGFLYGVSTAAGTTFNLGSNNLLNNNTISGNGTYIIGPGSTVVTGLYGGDTFYGSVQGSGSIMIGSNTAGSANTVSFQGVNTFTGSYNVAGGGTFAVTSAANIGAGGATNTITLDNGTLKTLGSFTGTQPLLVTANGGTLNTGGYNVGLGSISVAAGGSLNITAQNAGGGVMTLTTGSLNVSSGSVILATAAAHTDKTVLVTGGLSLAGSTSAWTGKVDLGGNDMIVKSGSLATVNNQAAQGFAGGTWQGSGGILSAAAAANTAHLTALGVIQNSPTGSSTGSALYGTFDGTTSTIADVLVKYTYYGDTNLDGKVDATDYTRIDSSFISETPTHSVSGWYNGDFNYDGVVNGSDYTLIDNAFNTQGAILSDQIASPLAQATAQIAAISSVPEPVSGSVLFLSAALLGRRKRSAHC